MATMDSLPNETLAHILSMLKEPVLTNWDSQRPQRGHYDSLRAAALVCSRWRDPAQRALLEDLVLDIHACSKRGQHFLSSPARSRHRTRAVIVVDRGEWVPVLQACPGIERLTLFVILDKPSWGVLAHPSLAGESFSARSNAVTLIIQLPRSEAPHNRTPGQLPGSTIYCRHR